MVEKDKIFSDIKNGDIVRLTVRESKLKRNLRKKLHLKEKPNYDLVGYAFILPAGVEVGSELSWLGRSDSNSWTKFEDILSYEVIVKKTQSSGE